MGSQVLEAGDGFFVPSDAPYAYEAGSEGVVVLEFRTATSFGMKIPGGQLERLRKRARSPRSRATTGPSAARAARRLTVHGGARRVPPGARHWLDQHADELRPNDPSKHGGVASLEDHMAQIAKVRRLTFDAGWARYGWPERVGGLGGLTVLRAYLSEAVTVRGTSCTPAIYSMPEVLGPSVITFAPPELSATMFPPLLRGDEVWCQGFSEPSTGSNLGALTCKSVRTEEGWRVTGQKVWTSLAQYAERCVLLTRTRHAGVGAPRHHRAVRRHGHARHHAAPDRDDARRARVLRGLLRRRAGAVRPHARGRGRRLGVRHGPAALRARARRCGSAPRSCTAGSPTCSSGRRPAWSTRPSSAR